MGETLDFGSSNGMEILLFKIFPNLFAKEVVQDIRIADKQLSDENGTNWSWQWINSLTDFEEQELNNLRELLVGFSVQRNCPDKWKWMSGPTCIFSVKSCYNLLLDLRQHEALDQEVLEATTKLWRNDVPSKIKVFGWRLLLERLPTRETLHYRGILNNPHDLPCVFCFRYTEDCAHLFYRCSFSKGIWEAVFNWVGKRFSTDAIGGNSFFFFWYFVQLSKRRAN
jgi:hypothetical protein